MIVAERVVKTILSKSGIPGADWCLNPYVGCAHACRYCYAEFMRRYSGHGEPWGTFVDAKVNAPEVLRRQLKRAKPGRVMISSVTDPYQPLEEKYRLTRRCLEELLPYLYPLSILTKSPLVLRDLDLLRRFPDPDVGLTITTDDERMRQLFEPGAPPIEMRIEALKKLHDAGVNTYVFIGPMLPMNPERLISMVKPYAVSILTDRMNYRSKTAGIFRRLGKEEWLDEGFAESIAARLEAAFGQPTVV